MATITREPDRSNASYQNSWGAWVDGNTDSQLFYRNGQSSAYAADVFSGAVTVTACSIKADFRSLEDDSIIRCRVYNADPVNIGFDNPIGTGTFSLETAGEPVSHTFSFSSMSASAQALYFVFDQREGSQFVYVTNAIVNVTATIPALSVTPTPGSIAEQYYIGTDAVLTFGNRLGAPLTVQFKHNNIAVREDLTANSDSVNVQIREAWFEAAGVSGSSMRVDVAVSDEFGRTASTYFNAIQPQGSTATPTTPKNTTVDGSESVNFTWSVSSDWGTQTRAELEQSSDGTSWQALATVYGSAQSWTAPAYKFSSGTVYWRVRVVNSFGKQGAWSSGVSFTYSFPALSVTPTPSAPSTPYYIGTNAVLTFGNRLNRQLTVAFKYGNIAVREALTVNEDSVSVPVLGSWFEAAGVSGSSMRVDLAVTDDLGRTASAYFSAIQPQGSTATATSPKNTTKDGAEAINFAWTISDDWGEQSRATLEWSTDNAIWTELETINGSSKTWTATALSFPSGTVYWRVKVTNTFGVVGAPSTAVSFTVKYDAVSQVVPVNSPTSGIINASNALTFGVALETTGQVYTPFTIAAATFYWRQGTSGNWTSVSMTSSGATAAVTIPANTFPHGTVQWYASATDNTGRTTETAVYTLTVMTAEVEATPISPINTVESGNGPITFLWSYRSADGSEDTAAGFKWSQDGTNWTEYELVKVGSNNLGVNRLTLPANTFAAGTVYWSVRSKNAANVWSDWSEIVSFRVFGAPLVAGVTANSRPFCTVTWQTEGQEAYEIEIDGESVGRWFGANVRSYTTRAPLSDGQHKIRVRAQNKYSLWSEWAECTADIVNVPGPAFFAGAMKDGDFAHVFMFGATIAPIITRQPQDYRANSGLAFFGVNFKQFTEYSPAAHGISVAWEYRTNGSATWQAYSGQTLAYNATPAATAANNGYQYRAKLSNAVGEIYSDPGTFYYGTPNGPASDLREGEWKAQTGYFLVYRDGKLIGKTYNNEFVDRFANGTHSYRVIQVVRNGYYTEGTLLSGFETVTIELDAPVIAALDGGDFFPLCLSDTAEAEITITRGVKTTRTYYSGARFPHIDIGEEEELSANLSTFWLDGDDENADKLEALLGEDVVLKLPRGRVLVGVLDSLPTVDSSYRRAYSVQLAQMEWREFVDES